MVNGLPLSVTLTKDCYLAALAAGHNTLVVTRPTVRVWGAIRRGRQYTAWNCDKNIKYHRGGFFLVAAAFNLCHRMPAPVILPQLEGELQKVSQIPTT